MGKESSALKAGTVEAVIDGDQGDAGLVDGVEDVAEGVAGEEAEVLDDFVGENEAGVGAGVVSTDEETGVLEAVLAEDTTDDHEQTSTTLNERFTYTGHLEPGRKLRERGGRLRRGARWRDDAGRR